MSSAVSTSTDIDINTLTQEVNKEVSKNKEMNVQTYLQKCFKTPLLYFTSVPVTVSIFIYFMQPNYIYDINPKDNKKIINYQKFMSLVFGGSIIINLFIHYHLKQNCKMNI